MRKRPWKVRGLRVLAIVPLAAAAVGLVVMLLWNWLMPEIFAAQPVTFWQALGLFVLAKILFGGFHRPSGRRLPRLITHWDQLSDEDRRKFRAAVGDEAIFKDLDKGLGRGCGRVGNNPGEAA